MKLADTFLLAVDAVRSVVFGFLLNGRGVGVFGAAHDAKSFIVMIAIFYRKTSFASVALVLFFHMILSARIYGAARISRTAVRIGNVLTRAVIGLRHAEAQGGLIHDLLHEHSRDHPQREEKEHEAFALMCHG